RRLAKGVSVVACSNVGNGVSYQLATPLQRAQAIDLRDDTAERRALRVKRSRALWMLEHGGCGGYRVPHCTVANKFCQASRRSNAASLRWKRASSGKEEPRSRRFQHFRSFR